jgi:RNA polymerase sigma factor (sigma-70 family)
MAWFRRSSNKDDADDDERWVAQVAAGGDAGRQGLEKLCKAYTPVLMRRLRAYRLTQAQTDDLVQGLWLDLWKGAARTYQRQPGTHAVEDWLWGIVHNKRKALYRANRRDNETLVPYHTNDASDDPDRGIDPQVLAAMQHDPRAEMAQREVERDFIDCMRRVFRQLRETDPDRAELLHRHVYDELPLATLAAWRGIKTHTLENYLAAARRLIAPWAKVCDQLLADA